MHIGMNIDIDMNGVVEPSHASPSPKYGTPITGHGLSGAYLGLILGAGCMGGGSIGLCNLWMVRPMWDTSRSPREGHRARADATGTDSWQKDLTNSILFGGPGLSLKDWPTFYTPPN